MAAKWHQLDAELEELRKMPQTPEVAQRINEIDAELDATSQI
jgi:hypothetical protein